MRKILNVALLWIVGLTLLFIILFLMGTLSGCTTTKEVSKTDSTYTKDLEQQVRSLQIENEKLTTEIHQLQYSEVRYDTIYIPGDTVVNTVTITKEGEVNAKGRISSVTVAKTLLSRIIAEKDKTIDSLTLLKQRETVKVVTVDKYKKVTVFPWYFWLITAAFAAMWLYKQLKTKQ